MTTIAIDGTTIAWDSRIVDSNGDYFDSVELCDKVRAHNGRIFAVCGDAGMLDFLINWWENGADWSMLPDHSTTPDELQPNWELLVIEPGANKIYTPFAIGAVIKVPNKWAIGSGALAAKAAMLCGKTAIEAVHIAKQLCVGTGGQVEFMYIGPAINELR